jgi:hypothetical protein
MQVVAYVNFQAQVSTDRLGERLLLLRAVAANTVKLDTFYRSTNATKG